MRDGEIEPTDATIGGHHRWLETDLRAKYERRKAEAKARRDDRRKREIADEGDE